MAETVEGITEASEAVECVFEMSMAGRLLEPTLPPFLPTCAATLLGAKPSEVWLTLGLAAPVPRPVAFTALGYFGESFTMLLRRLYCVKHKTRDVKM